MEGRAHGHDAGGAAARDRRPDGAAPKLPARGDERSMSDAPSEHARYHQYLRDLAHVSDCDELDLVGAVLQDPDQSMAVSAVLRHLDHRAGSLDGEEFAAWSARMAASVNGQDRLLRRIGDWTLFIAINAGQPIDAASLADATDWLQRKAAETATAPATLALLAEEGRTRRIRDIASVRARRMAQPGRTASSG